MQTRSEPLRLLVLPLVLLVAAAAYASALDADFITLDDPRYVILNENVRDGLTLDGVRWAFTTFAINNWHPLAWLSHMLDVSCFGIEPWGHHLTSVLLHLLNTTLLFAFLRRATGRLWEAAAVAALFALHPSRVESVAWVAERKDVLSTCFGLATLLAYVRFAERPSAPRSLLVFTTYALSLMAKPMLVTLPFVLLLLDVWPLGRTALAARAAGDAADARPVPWWLLVLEKLPLLALAAAISVVTLVAQRAGASSLDELSLGARVAHALAAYLGYLRLTLWPVGLAPYYPLPATPPLATAAIAAALLGAVSLLAVRSFARVPYVLVGWLWFLGTLVPVIGLVQVGGQAMADRYTYFPLVGLFIAAVWGASDLRRRWNAPATLLAAGAVCVLATCAVLTRTQVGYWRSSETLYRHTLDVMPDNSFAHSALATALLLDERGDEAEQHLWRAIEIDPKNPEALVPLAGILLDRDDVAQARALAARAVAVAPRNVEARLNLAFALERQDDLGGAIQQYQQAAQLEPQRPGVQLLLARALESRGDARAAVAHYQLELVLTPDSEDAREGLLRVRRSLRAAAAQQSTGGGDARGDP